MATVLHPVRGPCTAVRGVRASATNKGSYRNGFRCPRRSAIRIALLAEDAVPAHMPPELLQVALVQPRVSVTVAGHGPPRPAVAIDRVAAAVLDSRDQCWREVLAMETAVLTTQTLGTVFAAPDAVGGVAADG